MSIKRNNILFMWLALVFTGSQLFLGGMQTGWGTESLVPYLVCVGIAFLLMKKDGITFPEVVPFRTGIRAGTAIRIAALAFLLMPLAALLSEAGAMLGGNMMALFERSVSVTEQSFPEMLFSTAVIPALFEELFFRGFLYEGFKKARGARFAIIMTSVLFGFFHMNIQQILYAVVLGIVLAILREVTGSIWAGCLYHFVNNGWAVVTMQLSRSETGEAFVRNLPLERISFLGNFTETPSTGTVIYSLIMLIVCTALGVWILVSILRNEGRSDDLKRFFKKEDDPQESVVTFPFVVACVVFCLITVGITVMLKCFPEVMTFAAGA